MQYVLPKLITKEEPIQFLSLGNGIYYYNYNVTQLEDETFEFTQVRINGKPTVAKCIQAIYNEATDELGMHPTYDEDIIYQVKSDFGLVPVKSKLDKYKDKLINEIIEYDKSEDVNAFYYKGEKAWLDKATRVGLINSTTILKNNGEENTTLWLNNKAFTISCEDLLNLLDKLELYTIKCNNVTNQHKANVLALMSIQEYDYKSDYPLKLQFN